MTTRRDPRTRPVPHELRVLAQRRLAELGPRRAAESLGLGRTALLAVVAGADVLPGTIAILTLAAQREAA